ncbi:MAG: FMN-binding protein [Streptosporangiaceae bacterium]|jgi:uncharacterized protein with FMN-binding domain
MRRVILAIVSTVAVLVILLSIKTHSAVPLTTPPAAVGTPSGVAGGSGQGSGTGSGSSTAPGGSAGTTSAQTVTGTAAETMYGPVQVQITVKSRKLTAVNVIQYPDGTPRDAQINAYAIPQLTQEALAANSAKIDAISGATYTSGGYITSLQSALDKAGI